METIGQKIQNSRKKKGWKGQQLGDAVGLTKSGISQIENDMRKGVDPEILVKIADALDDLSILTHHCGQCPIKAEVFLRLFPDLNHIRKDPAIIALRLQKEMREGLEAIEALGARLSDADFQARDDFREVFASSMEQILDVKRCIEILEWELITTGAATPRDLKEVYDRQQAKCVAHGHHRPDQDEAAA